MTTLASAVAIGDHQIVIDAAMADGSFPAFVKIDSEILNVGGADNRTGKTLTLSAPATATHNNGATVTYAGRPYSAAFLAATAGTGGEAAEGTVVVTPPNEIVIGEALDASVVGGYAPSGGNPFITANEVVLANLLANDNDAGGDTIANLADPDDPQQAATKAYVDEQSPVSALAAVLAEGADTGGVEIRHDPAVDVDALTSHTAAATGTGNANARPLAQVVDGDAIAGPWAEATGSGATDACTYARSVDGDALADNDAASTGAGQVDAGCYANGVDGFIAAGAEANATGVGDAVVMSTATVNTGTATAGSLAVRGAASAGMSAVVDGTSARMAFNGTTPIAIPVAPVTPDGQDAIDILVALGLCTQAV